MLEGWVDIPAGNLVVLRENGKGGRPGQLSPMIKDSMGKWIKVNIIAHDFDEIDRSYLAQTMVYLREYMKSSNTNAAITKAIDYVQIESFNRKLGQFAKYNSQVKRSYLAGSSEKDTEGKLKQLENKVKQANAIKLQSTPPTLDRANEHAGQVRLASDELSNILEDVSKMSTDSNVSIINNISFVDRGGNKQNLFCILKSCPVEESLREPFIPRRLCIR